jgi:hypothetical protein
MILSLAALALFLGASTPALSHEGCCKAGKVPCCSEQCCKLSDNCCKGMEHKACEKPCKETPAAPK